MTQKEINKLLKNSIKLLKKLDIPISENIDNNIYLNNRYKKILATCDKKNSKYIIEINSHILHSNKKILEEIIIHELIHTIKGCYNHSPLFQRYCHKINNLSDYNIQTLYDFNSIVYDNMNVYEIECQKCHKKYRFYLKNDKVKNTNNYICHCGGNLILQDK